MAQCRRLKIAPDARRDLISALPVEVKDRILECLPTRDAARAAVLSKSWNDVWLQHGRLAFDWDFLLTVPQCRDNYARTLVNIINNILFSRVWPVKKFTLQISYNDPWPAQSDIDRWCLFLSRNGVEELNISLDSSDDWEEYKLPFCLLSCRTIKQLIVRGPSIDLPVNACGIFSNVTSLAFYNVEFKCSVSGIGFSISFPNLEKMAFGYCRGIDKFEIGQPKLEMLSVIGSMYDVVDSRWLAPHMKAIKTLWLSDSSLWGMDVSAFPTAINLQVMKLYELNFGLRKHLVVAMQLLQKCPNLCELRIIANELGWKDDKEAASRLLEDLNGGFVIQELKMLNTIKIESFRESAFEMLFMKMLLSKSPALERVVIVNSWGTNASRVRKIQRKLECFPRASPNAQIVCMGYYASMRDDWMDTHGFVLSRSIVYE
ncbi:F-box/FBD/LRR-repeat protein At1g13570-like isoform X1 [Ipomoea triloba]|uniref:F-box/FBD/LRR-repeat protein At1g13570-like isoform X1 n=1 Tax=Ipomoea triloba TaxID=35885 RepID=UPI00125D0D19|nr:F-box/FBD/LRR-repeat protein At1g13570-like isoform X1 [Ipomoea triloba]